MKIFPFSAGRGIRVFERSDYLYLLRIFFSFIIALVVVAGQRDGPPFDCLRV